MVEINNSKNKETKKQRKVCLKVSPSECSLSPTMPKKILDDG
jgi:hypothetical protein